MSKDRLTYLFARHLAKTATVAEKTELSALSLDPANEETVRQLLDESWEQAGEGEGMPGEKMDAMLKLILHDGEDEVSSAPGKVRRLNWRRIAAAAAIALLIMLAVGGYYVFNNKRDVTIAEGQGNYKDDVPAPHDHKATLKLPDGTIIALDTIRNGSVIAAGSKINDGELVYNGTGNVQMLTLNVPRGSRPMKITLADQTKVWLNAGSSLTYPSAFTGATREVSMTGEVYFEVTAAHPQTSRQSGTGSSQREGASKAPFIVKHGNTEVTVLGTHFNVNAYDDEADIKVTLLEGSVEVKSQKSKIKIVPGQQAVISQSSSDISINSNADLEEVMAWKNGLFRFKGLSMEAIMRQLSYWYDIEVEYKTSIPDYGFNARISRDEPISEMLKILELTGLVHFEIKGKKVIVSK